MPNNLIKSLSKKSGKSTSDIEKGWKGGEEEAEKKGLTGDSKYAYMNAAAQHAAGKKKKEGYVHNGTNWEYKDTDFPSLISEAQSLLDQLSRKKVSDNQYNEDIPDFVKAVNLLRHFVSRTAPYQKREAKEPLEKTPDLKKKVMDDPYGYDADEEGNVTKSSRLKRFGKIARDYVSPKNEDFQNPNQIQQGVEAQGRAMNKPIDHQMVNNAFELNKQKADKEGLDKNSEDYWATVASGTGKDAGLYSDQRSLDQRGRGAMFQRESYITFEEELEGIRETTPDEFTHTESPKNAGDRDEHLEGYTKIELAKEFAKNLKKKGLSRNEIIHAIIARLIGIDKESARKIVDGEEVDGIDNVWAPTDQVAPGYQNSVPTLYSDVDQYKENEKKKS